MYPLCAPISIGGIEAVTLQLGVAAVVFESPAAFTAGDAIDFTVLVPSDTTPMSMHCSGFVTRCDPRPGPIYEIAASIDGFRISPPGH